MSAGIGIFGGSFDPIHIGHLILAQDAFERLHLSRIMFIPCRLPPHKNPARLLPAETRLAMLRLALENDPRFAVSEIEVRREGVSYSVETVREIRRIHPGSPLVFIVGADTLPELHLWKDIYDLLEMCRVVGFARPGWDIGRLCESDVKLKDPWPRRLLADLVEGHTVNVSSSDIRRRVAQGESIRYLVPAEVESYIRKHRLYLS